MAQKMDQNCKLRVRLFQDKNQNFEKLLQDCFCLMEDYIYLKFDLISVIFGRDRAPTPPPKGDISWILHRYKNIWKFIFRQPQML